jgi:hypothetical protein
VSASRQRGPSLERTLAALALATLVFAAPAARAQADTPPTEKAKEDQFILVAKGEIKGKSLLDAEVICEFRKFIQGVPGADSSRLLTFRFTRDVSADQLREVFRGLVEGHTGSTSAEREALMRTLGPMVKGSTLEFRWGSGPMVEVRIQGAGRRQAEARRVTEAIWSRLE